MSTFFSQSYKPQVLSRQEGFHLPTPSPPTPPAASSSNGGQFNDLTHGLFSAPFLSIPDPFRKFPAADHAPLDFDELSGLISPVQGQHAQQSNERSTQSPAYDDYRPPPHNIFDISAPTPHHSHSQSYAAHTPGAHAYSLPPASSLHGPAHGLDFAHTHFNSTLPALGSSMRYEPAPPNAPAAGAEPSSFSSFSSISTFPDFHPPQNQQNQNQQPNQNQNQAQSQRTPSPSTPLELDAFSRSRSRSRPAREPPSTNGGPARRTRAKRNSVSSVSPPPLHRGHTQPLVIPGIGGARAPASPLGLHATTAPAGGAGWFLPGPGEFLPTPESVHGGFSAFTGPGSLSQSLSQSYTNGGGHASSYSGPGAGLSPKVDSPVAEPDAVAKQALLANEKRRRRRESHNAVERRRRDNINEKISELATLIPECLLDPNATFTMPATLNVPEQDLMFGAGWRAREKEGSPKDAEREPEPVKEKEKEKDGSAEPDDKEAEGAAVKANKGMILRKSVEYIRYLQQLVSAQASRNRELEQQLAAVRGGPPPPADSPAGEELGMLLHEEVDAAPFGFFGFGGAPAGGAQQSEAGTRHRRRASSAMRRGFSGFELERVEEDEMDVDERKDPAGSLPSPDPEDEDDGAEEPEQVRGRKGRDGRPVGVGLGVKEEGMES